MMFVGILSVAVVLGYCMRAVYRASPFHPLGHIPGPWWASISSFWLQYHTFTGTQCSAVHRLHERYGPIIRTGPNEIEISDGAALWPIYIANGGLQKSHHYSVLDIDGHSTLFSTLKSKERAERLRVALPFFSAASVRDSVSLLEACAEQLIRQLERDRKEFGHTELLDRCRRFTLNATSNFVFGAQFDDVAEEKLSIAAIVDAFLESNRLFNLPSYIKPITSFCYDNFVISTDAKRANAKVDTWLREVINSTARDNEIPLTYHAKLLNSGMQLSTVVAEGKDTIFGATDGGGLNLAMILWHLVAHRQVYVSLHEELHDHQDIIGEKLQTLPLLSGVVKESMRLSSSVPCKLPRETGKAMVYSDIAIPSGVVVGVAPYELHFNEAIFPEPHTFIPQRWQRTTEIMERNWMPFGKGSRACIGRHLALMQLHIATAAIVRSGVLSEASTLTANVTFWEWYNAGVRGHKVELAW